MARFAKIGEALLRPEQVESLSPSEVRDTTRIRTMSGDVMTITGTVEGVASLLMAEPERDLLYYGPPQGAVPLGSVADSAQADDQNEPVKCKYCEAAAKMGGSCTEHTRF